MSSAQELNFRAEYAARREHRVIGLMSGTSLDGVDAVLTRIVTKDAPRGASTGPAAHAGEVERVELEGHYYVPYTDEMRRIVGALCKPETARVDDLTYIHFGLSEWYAAAVLGLLEKTGRAASEIDLIAMHGQTVWHAPALRDFPGPGGSVLKVKGTLQLGCPAVLHERTGIAVAADFRSADMAAGGEGAPLAPCIDGILFGSGSEGRAVQNIGGIGNVTVLPAGCPADRIFAFDTGPGNMLIDEVVAAGTGGAEHYDPDGRYGAKGSADPAVVDALMSESYFSRKPPKSTGREVYGEAFAASFIKDCAARGLSFEDEVATATAFTAESIAAAYRDFVIPSVPLGMAIISGGGALNLTLMKMLAERLPGIKVVSSAELGVPVDAREAMAFAVLGHESLMGRPGNLPAVTGAKRPVVLGTLTL